MKTQALLARLTELPVGVPGTITYEEIERIQGEKKLIEEKLGNLKTPAIGQEIVKPLDYERFLVRLLRMVDADPSVGTRKAIVTALIHRLEIRENGFRLAYYVGAGQMKTGEALASPAFSFGKKISSESSCRFENGGLHLRVVEPYRLDFEVRLLGATEDSSKK